MVLVNEGKCGCMYVEMMTLLRWKEEIGQALYCRRRIKTEEKGKVVTVVWWTYLNVALTIKHQV